MRCAPVRPPPPRLPQVLIYEGQSAVLGKTSEGPCLAEMAEHEREHLQKFQDLVRKRRQAALPARAEQRAPAPPSASPGISDAERKHPLTSAAGGRLGPRAASRTPPGAPDFARIRPFSRSSPPANRCRGTAPGRPCSSQCGPPPPTPSARSPNPPLSPRALSQPAPRPARPAPSPTALLLSLNRRRAGAGSALLGKEAAYAVTEAVEEVISEHYNAQLRELLDSGLQDEEELREARAHWLSPGLLGCLAQ